MSGIRRTLLTDAQRLAWLRLYRTDGVGPRTFRALVNFHGGAEAALAALPMAAARTGKPISVCTVADAEREMAAAARRGVRFIALGEEDYPDLVAQIADPPPLIGVRGDAAIFKRPAAAIVGSRNASAAGQRFAETLARGVGEAGFVVVSGLARGVDARAHEASLSTGTVAVLAGGHDHIYPAEHEPLAERIIGEGGAILSEMPIGWTPRGRDFPRRNRLVSGLALGVVVVEAARKSGSLITARFALEQGREVFAAPGSPLDPRAEGANDLIRQGATLVTEPDHVIEALRPLFGAPKEADGFAAGEPRPGRTPLWEELDLVDLGVGEREAPTWSGFADSPETADLNAAAAETRVLDLLSMSPVDVDELARLAETPVRAVQAIIAELDLAGRVERHGANRVSLRPQ